MEEVCGERELTKWYTEDFQGSESTLCDIRMVDSCHTFVKLIECT
jgi:hypothetical protein